MSERKINSSDEQVYNRESSRDPLRTYLQAIGKVALLDAAEEVELAKRIEAGLYAQKYLARVAGENVPQLEDVNPDEVTLTTEERQDLQYVARDGERAKHHMLEANLRLVVSMAKRYQGKGMDLPDLIQEGSMGLIRAVEKFDYMKGFKLSTYATWWIRQSITRGLADQSRTIRIPTHMVETITKVKRVERELHESLGREPSIKEIAEEAKVEEERVQEALSYKDPVSLDVLVGEDESAQLSDFIEDADALTIEEQLEYRELHVRMEAYLRTRLDEREYDIIARRYGLNGVAIQTLNDIGTRHGLTRERIRQIQQVAEAKLARPSDDEDEDKEYQRLKDLMASDS